VPGNLTHHVEKIFGNQTGLSKSDRDDMRDSRNRLQNQTNHSPRKEWEETIDSVDMTLTVSEKPKVKQPTKVQTKVVRQATEDLDDYEDDDFDSFSISKSAASAKLNQHKRFSSNLSYSKEARIEEAEDDSDEKYTSVEKSLEKSDTQNKVGKVKIEVRQNIGGKPEKQETEEQDGTDKNDDESDDVSDSYTVSLS